MLELEEAQSRILDTINLLPAETVKLAAADARFLPEPVIAKIDLPGFDNSAVDGFAVQSKDIATATREKPFSLRLIGKIPAGEVFSGKIEPGQCARIFTGSPLPQGADAVAMQEDAKTDAKDPATVLFLDSVKPWENIRFQGEDVKSGTVLINAGASLNAGRLSLLAAVGADVVRVTRQPVVGLLATGNELREPGQAIAPGQLFESNRIALSLLANRVGAMPRIFPLVPDTLEGTKGALQKAFAECDAVVTTGGVSVGELDFVKEAFERLGGKLDFWKVSMKPGKPFVFGQWREKYLFGLPGNPVSAFVTFVVLVAPALARMQGARNFSWPTTLATLGETMSNRGDRRHFVRVLVDPRGEVRSAGTQASHVLSSLAKANGLLEIRAGETIPAGATVSVLRLD